MTTRMTHTQYVHYLIDQMHAHDPPTRAHASPRRENIHNVAATPSTPAPRVAVHAICEPLQMKALSIKQPYAGLIIAGIKNVENRSWSTKYTGQLVICATKSPDAKEWWEPMREKCKRLGVTFPEALCEINGAALGVVDFNYLVWTNENEGGRHETNSLTLTDEQVADWWNPDMIGFILEHPRQLL